MTLGDYITWMIFAAGAYALGVIAWRRLEVGKLLQMLSTVSERDPDEIMSRTAEPLPSEPVSPRTDAPADGRTEPAQPVARPATLDTVRSLREHGYTREEARAFLKPLGWTLGNDTWAAAKPALPSDDDAFVTPYAGRVTKRSFYTDADFPYEEPKV